MGRYPGWLAWARFIFKPLVSYSNGISPAYLVVAFASSYWLQEYWKLSILKTFRFRIAYRCVCYFGREEIKQHQFCAWHRLWRKLKFLPQIPGVPWTGSLDLPEFQRLPEYDDLRTKVTSSGSSFRDGGAVKFCSLAAGTRSSFSVWLAVCSETTLPVDTRLHHVPPAIRSPSAGSRRVSDTEDIDSRLRDLKLLSG